MKIVTLLENTACDTGLTAAHGLSLYLETPKHKILFDMGPDRAYLDNAEKLGVDLTQVDVAILSHGHSDHGGGLMAFCQMNARAQIYLRKTAFGQYYTTSSDADPRYIGLDPALDAWRDRFVFTGDELVIDQELTLFSAVPDDFGAMCASAALLEKTVEGFQQDLCTHEQDLLVTAEGKSVLLAGCAHRGIVNILHTAEKRLGKRPDVTFGGFHLFRLKEGSSDTDALIQKTGQALLSGETVYYTGHCTGDYAYQRLKNILGERLQPMSGGVIVKI